MHFGGWGLSGFGDIATFKNGQISLSDHGLYSPWRSKKYNHIESAQKIHASRGWCKMYARQAWWA